MKLKTSAATARPLLAAAAILAGWAIAPASAQAQSIVMAGNYQNFDVLNNTGGTVYGFEMEVYGISKSQLTRIFPSNFPNLNVIRYGVGTAMDFPGGVRVRWAAAYDPSTGTYSTSTPTPPNLTSVPGDSCWTLGMPSTYQTAGCEHFGISAVANPTTINYYWLVQDPAKPGTLIPNNTYVNLPAPVWVATPPANPALPPVVVAEVQAPPAPPAKFGPAEWVKVYKVEQAGKVDLNDLVGDNHAVVPEAVAQLEVSWSLLQADPADGGGNQRRRGKLANGGNVGNGNHAVVRRYEYYQYSGVLDPVTNEALCADLTCAAPSPGELGDAIGAQNAAANLDVNALTVAITGGGNVSSADKVFSCGNKCYGVYAPGASVVLTAKANSGSTFLAWSGGCVGNSVTCTVTLDQEKTVTAQFTTVVAGGGGGGAAGGGGGGGGSQFTLSVGRTNPGNVTSDVGGINCGSACSAKVAAGTTITLTATPPAGKSFSGWSGGCAGVAPTCAVTLATNTSVQAIFTK